MANFTPDEQREFYIGTDDVTFLFDKAVKDYVDLVNKKAAKLHYHIVSQKARDEKYSGHVRAESDLILWFAEQLKDDGLARIFGDYLQFRNL